MDFLGYPVVSYIQPRFRASQEAVRQGDQVTDSSVERKCISKT